MDRTVEDARLLKDKLAKVDLYSLGYGELIEYTEKLLKEIETYKTCFSKIEKVLDKSDAKSKDKWY